MPARYSRFLPALSLTGDFILLNAFFVFGFCLTSEGDVCLQPKFLLFFTYLNISWLVLVFIFGANKITRNTQKKSILFSYIRIIVFYFFLFLMFFQLTPLEYYSRDFIRYLFPLYFVTLMVFKFGLYYLFLLYRKWGFNFRNVIILAHTPGTEQLADYFTTNKWHGYRFLGFFDSRKNKQVIGDYSGIREYLERNPVHEIYMAAHAIPQAQLQQVIETIADFPVQTRIVPELGNFSYKSTELIQYGDIPVIMVHPGPLSYWYNQFIKRLFDVVLSLVVIAGLLSWMIPLLSLISLFGSRGGVFFKQRRTAMDGKEFTCYKFRSMRVNEDADKLQAVKQDQRVTSIGRFLRKYSLDELPQFFNVLKGNMSVVGPRPHMLKHTEAYRKLVKRFMLRHTVKPGITGLAQVNGFRGEIKNLDDIKNRFKHDVNYIENWSFNMDVKIIFITVWLILRGKLWAY